MSIRKFKDKSGQKFGDLIVIELHHIKKKYDGKYLVNIKYYLCKCICGNEAIICSKNLINGVSGTKSCGCRKNGEWAKTHGMYGTPEYICWRAMKNRCYNKNDQFYYCYGGRGIKVCDRWLNSFENFYEDMGPKISSEHTLDRFDNDGDYEDSNCFWATVEEQANNRSNNRKMYYNGEELSIAQWERKFGFNRDVIRDRLRRGKTFEEAIKRN